MKFKQPIVRFAFAAPASLASIAHAQSYAAMAGGPPLRESVEGLRLFLQAQGLRRVPPWQ